MDFVAILGQTNSYLDTDAYFHNNIDINNWFKSKKVDITQKLSMFFGFLYTTDENKNKKPEERIYAQNGYLEDLFDVEKITIQKGLLKLEQMNIIDRKFINRYQELVKKEDAHGVTKRRIILKPNKLKDLLSTLPSEQLKSGYKARSKERRFITRRPISIVRDVVNSIIKTQVNDVKNRKQKISKELLELQFKKYKDFGITPEVYVAAEDSTLRDFNFLVHQPPDRVNLYYIERN